VRHRFNWIHTKGGTRMQNRVAEQVNGGLNNPAPYHLCVSGFPGCWGQLRGEMGLDGCRRGCTDVNEAWGGGGGGWGFARWLGGGAVEAGCNCAGASALSFAKLEADVRLHPDGAAPPLKPILKICLVWLAKPCRFFLASSGPRAPKIRPCETRTRGPNQATLRQCSKNRPKHENRSSSIPPVFTIFKKIGKIRPRDTGGGTVKTGKTEMRLVSSTW
jgi:hypothetical protein